MKTTKPWSLLLLLAIISACGNPHVASEESKQILTAISGAQSQLEELKKFEPFVNLDVRPLILDQKGQIDKEAMEKDPAKDLTLVAQNKNSATSKLVITNLSSDEVNLDFSLEKGKLFSKEHNGIVIKGLPPVCDKSLGRGKTCYIDVSFSSAKEGHFQDNLYIDYSLTIMRDKAGQKKFGLKGERIEGEDKDEDDPKVVLKAWGPKRKAFVDFGATPEKEEKSERIRIKNRGKEHVGMLVQFRIGKHFAFSGGTFPGREGTCKDYLVKRRACWLEVEFIGNDPGLYSDDLIITYQDPEAKKTISLTINLLGERIKAE